MKSRFQSPSRFRSTVEVEVTVEIEVPVTVEAPALAMPTRVPVVTPTQTADPGGVKLCRLHRRRRALIDAVIAKRNVEVNTKRMNETLFEMVDVVDEYGLNGQITQMELITDTGMEAWCQRRGLLPSN